MRRQRKAKIVATLGPASTNRKQIEALFRAGADIFRLIEDDLDRPIGVLVDLQGPKIRVGTFKDGGVELVVGQPFRFDLDAKKPGDVKRAPLPHPEVLEAVKPGSNLLLDDGRLRLVVT